MPTRTARQKDDLRILFVNPCLRKNSNTKYPPVGLAYVMTYFDVKGYRFDLLDLDLHEYDDGYIERYIATHKYDVILLGSIVTHYKWVKWFVTMAKRSNPDCRIIVGNSVGGSIPEVLLQHSPADIVVIGEGEVSAYEAVEAIRCGSNLEAVDGIMFRSQTGRFIRTSKRIAARVDDLPMVRWDYFDINKYIRISAYSEHQNTELAPEDTRPLPVCTARGCAFKCTFCHYVYWDDPYRNRSPQSILNEIRRNIELYDANYIMFWDDLSFASAKQVEQLADAILDSGLKFYWSGTIRVDVFSRSKLSQERSLEVAMKMRRSGCRALGFSLESGNQQILEMMNKKIDASAFVETVRILKAADITCNTSVVFGYPIETKETIRDTFEQCLRARVYPSIGFLLPLPSTGMYQYARDHGYIVDDDIYLTSITERQDICINMTHLSDEEIMNEIQEGARKLNAMLNLNLGEGELIRTKVYKNYKTREQTPLEPGQMHRIENDVSFNYSKAVFEVDSGL